MAWKIFGNKKRDVVEQWNYKTMFGPNMSFAATEAYKLLRTNIMFSFSKEGRGHVIGVASSVQDEGKTSSACNTAYALAESGVKVLLLEADLRRPSIAAKLGIARSPGLTNLLVSDWDYKEMIQHCSAAPKLDIITSGDTPPNPSELLGSQRMADLINMFTAEYDYIIVDLPPVTVVSDTVAISRNLNGIVMVVRGNSSDRRMLAEAMRQLRMADVRILGFVYRDSSNANRKYGKKYRYKYYKGYGKGKEEK